MILILLLAAWLVLSAIGITVARALPDRIDRPSLSHPWIGYIAWPLALAALPLWATREITVRTHRVADRLFDWLLQVFRMLDKIARTTRRSGDGTFNDYEP